MVERIDEPPFLPPRPNDANKVTTGRVLVVGGSRALAGAPAMAGLGALRAGAGLVKIAVPGSIQDVVAGFQAEATTTGLPENAEGGLGSAAVESLRTLVAQWDAVVLGPGAGRHAATLSVIREFAVGAQRPLAIDADGLFAWNEQLEQLQARTAPTVLTPHEGEAARLLGVTSEAVRTDREAAAVQIAQSSGGVAVLKGPGTVVTDGTRLFRNRTGGPVLASGGTGDVLAGIVGAFLAQMEANGLDAFASACLAVHVHGAAADLLAQTTDRGVLATEIAAAVPRALAERIRPGARREA